MERATRQSVVFKANLNHNRENAARSSASSAQVLRDVALRGVELWATGPSERLMTRCIEPVWIERDLFEKPWWEDE
jgi:hypothetical protein